MPVLIAPLHERVSNECKEKRRPNGLRDDFGGMLVSGSRCRSGDDAMRPRTFNQKVEALSREFVRCGGIILIGVALAGLIT